MDLATIAKLRQHADELDAAMQACFADQSNESLHFMAVRLLYYPPASVRALLEDETTLRSVKAFAATTIYRELLRRTEVMEMADGE